MRNILVALVVVPCLGLSACGGGGQGGDSQTAEASVVTGQEFVLGFGETMRVHNLTLEFTTLADESRCPIGVHCVWEGNGRILVTATLGSASAVLDLNTNARFPVSATFEGYRVELVRLDPYPRAPLNGPLPPVESYEATLLVTRANS